MPEPLLTIFLLPCSGAGVRPGPHHRRGGHSDGGGRRLPTEPLQSLHTFLHQSSQPEPETRRRPAAGKCEPGPSGVLLGPVLELQTQAGYGGGLEGGGAHLSGHRSTEVSRALG